MSDKPCEFPRHDGRPRCPTTPTWYVMGAYPGDWAVRVCDEHRDWAHDTFSPYIEERLAPPTAPGPPEAVG